MKKPLILEIKGNSLDDGPGIRTVIFFKGCPLSCIWCHNPESKSSEAEISYDAKDCIGCSTCVDICPEGAINKRNPHFIDRDKCSLCFQCIEECPAGVLSRVGKQYEIQEIVQEIEKDMPFFANSGGGVTLSGGEPALYIEFTSHLMKALRKHSIHILFETSGQFEYKQFMSLLYPYLDLIYFDIKIINSEDHKHYCGISNNRILNNFTALYKRYRTGGIEVLPRVPLIPNYTAKRENLSDIACFLRKQEVEKVALLPYNPLWKEKISKLGLHNPFFDRTDMTCWMQREDIELCRSLFSDFIIESDTG